MYLGRIRPGSRGERNPQREIGNRASTYESVWHDEVDPQVYWTEGGGVSHVPKRTKAVSMNSLHTSRNKLRTATIIQPGDQQETEARRMGGKRRSCSIEAVGC